MAASLADDRTKKNMLYQVEQMHRSGIDLRAYLDEVRRQPLPVKWYLTWTLSHFLERYPEQGAHAEQQVWEFLRSCGHEGMQRDLWRCLSFMDIGDDLSGEIYNCATAAIVSVKKPIAVRVHAMTVAYRIARPYPELMDELYMLLETLKNEESPGIRTRSKHIRELIKRSS